MLRTNCGRGSPWADVVLERNGKWTGLSLGRLHRIAVATAAMFAASFLVSTPDVHAQEWTPFASSGSSAAKAKVGRAGGQSSNASSSKASSSTNVSWSPWDDEVTAPTRSKPKSKSSAPSKPPRSSSPLTTSSIDSEEDDTSFTPRSPRERRERIRQRESWAGKSFAPQSSGKWQWKVTKEGWTAADEAGFAEFIRLLGESECKTTHECLTSPVANPKFHDKNPPGWQFFADCADLPFVLRAYYAWMNGLPFSYSTALSVAPSAGSGSKPRGRNDFPIFHISGRRDIVGPGPDGRLALADVSIVSTGHFRTPADYTGRLLPDHYPVKVDRASIRAGTVMFDPLGHIAVVYKVTDDGNVHFIDAHPDNSLTRGVYGSEIERSGPESGSGFRNWRPQKLVGAKRLEGGILSGGEVQLAADKELPDWSDEQYYGNGNGATKPAQWQDAKFTFEGDAIDYYGFVRMRLAKPGFRYNPIEEVATKVDLLCKEIGYRVDAVKIAIDAGIHQRPQPARLPKNIYVTQGYWETYSTPSRDAQLKSMFRSLREDIARYIALHAQGSKLVVYAGSDLRGDIMAAYNTAAAKCTTTYIKSDGKPQTMGFEEVKRRLFKMSFDPHHCVERRWGADDPAELKSCTDGSLKTSWYNAQQRLRNQLVRTIGDRMDFSLEDLNRQAREDSDVGENEPPSISVADVLVSKGIPTVVETLGADRSDD